MSQRLPAAAVLLLAAAVLVGSCASALKPLDPSSDLGRVDPERVDPAAADRLAAEAEDLFSRRPELTPVERAERLWLESAIASPTSARGIIGAVRTKVWLAHHLEDRARRRIVARSAVETAQWCGRREPNNPACHYWLALALGVQADAHRATAVDGLRHMVRQLRRVIESAPELEQAGPHRILARVLVRAPGWPTGPGDPDAGLEHAKLAVQMFPQYPPNLLALAAAYREVDEIEASRARFQEALEMARQWQQRGDPDAGDWIQEANQGLQRVPAM